MDKKAKIAASLQRAAETERRFEEALVFLVEALAHRPTRGKKPVVLHSLRVGSRLMTLGYSADVVIAGLLHDVLEKSSRTSADLNRAFGPEVAALVVCVTKDRRITDPMQRYADTVQRAAAFGEAALALRAVDLIDNCDRLTALFRSDRLQRINQKLALVEAAGRREGIEQRLLEDLGQRLKATASEGAALPAEDPPLRTAN